MLILLVANIAVIQGIGLAQIRANQLDRAEAEEVVRCIREYEAESGQTVDTISWRRDSEWTQTRPEITYTFMDMNVRAGGRSWSLTDCISYYAGRRFQSEAMSDEIWSAYFPEKDWDSLVSEEQIWFEGHTMYLMVY